MSMNIFHQARRKELEHHIAVLLAVKEGLSKSKALQHIVQSEGHSVSLLEQELLHKQHELEELRHFLNH